MALSRSQKSDKVKKLAGELETSTSAIIGTFTGLTASKDFSLRKTVRAAGGSYHVVKNKLAAKSAEGTKIEAALKGLKGVNSVAYTSGDPVALAKALSTWVKDNSELQLAQDTSTARLSTFVRLASWRTCRARKSSSRSCFSLSIPPHSVLRRLSTRPDAIWPW